MAGPRKAYRNTRTGGVRWSTSALGYPYEAASDADIADLPNQPEKKSTAKSTEKKSDADAKS